MRILLALSLAALVACSSNDTKEEVDLGPNALSGFDEEISLNTEWRQQVGKGQGNAYARLQPAIQDNVVYAADAHGLVTAFELDSGDQLWDNQFDVEITAAVALGPKFGYVASANGELIAFDLKTGDETWRSNVQSEILSLPVQKGGQVVAQTIDGHLYLLNADSGAIKWSYDSNLPYLYVEHLNQSFTDLWL